MKNKKLIVGFCTTAAALGAAAAATGVVLSLNNTNSQYKGDYKLTFDAGNGRFKNANNANQMVYANQSLDRTPQPEVVSNRSGELFSGWQDEQGRLVTGKQTFNKDTKLTATYNSATTGDFCTVTFLPGDATGVVLQGNTSITVKKGYLFFMINRPSATAPQKYFNNWVYAADVYDETGTTIIHKKGDKVGEKDEIYRDVKLQPDWTQAVTITWDPGDGGTIKRGQSTTTLEYGSVFNDFNQPQLTSIEGKFFQAWYREDGVTQMKPTDPITSNMTVVAHWGAPKVAEGYASLNFVTNESEGQPTTQFAPSAFQVVHGKVTSVTGSTGDTWGKTVRPTVTTADGNWDLASSNAWQIREKAPNSETWSDWAALGDEKEFISEYSYQIRPIMELAIKSVDIIGDDTLLPEDSRIKYLAPVTGGKSQDVNWELYSDSTCQKPLSSSIASIEKGADGAGYVTVQSTTESDLSTFYIKATSVPTIGTTSEVSTVKEINIVMPYASTRNSYNKLVWFRKDFGAAGVKWASFNPTELCTNLKDKEGYTYTFLADRESTGKMYLRDTWTDTLYLGRAISIIPEQFMINWTGFNGEMNLGSQVTEIQGAFMENCTSFNKTIDLSTVTTIGNHFLYNASSFNNGGNALTFNAALTSIGDDFLAGCSSFNQTITLPTTNDLKIGSSFLYGCQSFNKDLTIPKNVKSVGAFFMTLCGAYTSTLTVNASSISVFSGSIHDISCEGIKSDDGTMYPLVETGFKVSGTLADAFATKYPEISDGANFAYRKYQDSYDGKVEAAEYEAAMKQFLIQDGQPWNAQYTATQTSGKKTASYFFNVYQESASNAASPIYIKETQPWGDVNYYTQDLNLNGIFVVGDSKGNFYRFSSQPEIIENVLQFRKLFTATTAGFGDFTYQETGTYAKMYRYTPGGEEPELGYNIYVKFRDTGTVKQVSRVDIVQSDDPTGEDYVMTIDVNYGTGLFELVNVKHTVLTKATTQTYSATGQSWLPDTAYGYGLSFKDFTAEQLATLKYNNFQLSTPDLSLTTEDPLPSAYEIYFYNKLGEFNFEYAGEASATPSVPEGGGTVTWSISPIQWTTTETQEYKQILNSMVAVFTFQTGDTASDMTLSFTLSNGTLPFINTGLSELVSYINEYEAASKSTEAEQQAAEQALCNHFTDVNWNSAGTTPQERLQEFYGKECRILIDGVVHYAKIIDILHDTYTDSSVSKTALFTFELSSVLTSKETTLVSGRQYKTYYKSTFGTNNWDYSTSTLRANLNGTGTKSWATSALDMLPAELKATGAIKPANKQYQKSTDSGASFTLTSIADKLFPLTHTELGATIQGSTAIGIKYWWYNNYTDPSERGKTSAEYYMEEDEAYWMLYCGKDENVGKVYGIFCETGEVTVLDPTTEHAVYFGFCI